MDILLIHPYTQRRTFCPPLGILYLAGTMRSNGYNVRVLDMDTEQMDDEQLVLEAREMAPLLIGITCNIVQASEAMRLARLLSPVASPIAVGGPFPSAAPERIMTCKAVDFCVIGEGEQTLVELAAAIASGNSASEVAGLMYRSDGDLHRTTSRPFLTDLDSLPFPAHDLNGGIAKYARNPTPAPETPLAAVLPSRGCPFNCNFCSNPWKTTNRKRSVGNVIEELGWLIEDFGVKQIFFYDDSFNSNPEYTRELCQAILDSKLSFGWRADCRANSGLVDLETLKLMKESGCWLLAFGVETGNSRVMKSLNKGLKLEDVVRARELCSQADILFRGFFMVGALEDSYISVFDTIDFARRLEPDDPQFSIFSPIVGTDAFEVAKRNGWIIDDSWENLDSFHATVSTSRLSAHETQMLHDLATLVVPQWWKPSYEKRRVAVPDIPGEMRKRFGKEGLMVTEMWQTYQRNPREHSSVIVLLNPPSPPGFTSGKDTMGGFGQVFKGEYVDVVPPVDMAYLAARKRDEGLSVYVIDAVGSHLDAAHTLSLVQSLEPAEILIRTSVATLEFDQAFSQQLEKTTGVAPELFGPAVGKSILDEDLDDLPLPAWELFPDYALGGLSAGHRYLPIQGSVGCAFDCDYCPYPVAQGTEFRSRTPESICREIKHFNQTLGVDFFLFRDPIFTFDRDRTLGLCDLLIESDLSVAWRCETRADLLDDELLQRMAKAGCVGINFGVESLSQEAISLVHRKEIPQEQLASVVQACKRLGIDAFVFYIVGLPGETREGFMKTLQFAKQLDTPFVQFTPITAYPNTRLEKWARQNGYVSGELSDAPFYGSEPLMRNESLTTQDIKELCNTAYCQTNVRGDCVALFRCTDYAAVEPAVQNAVNQLGGIEAFVKPGQRVLIKPNLIGSYQPDQAATTHPEVVRAVIRMVKNAGGVPVVGDSPGGAELPSYKQMRRLHEVTGMADVCKTEEVELVDFSQSGSENIPIQGKRLSELTVSKAVTGADVIISLPKAKTHAFTYYTGAIKNLYGVVPGLRKAEYHKLAPSPQEFAELLNDIHDAVQPKVKLVIMDAVIGMDGNGPTAGRPRRGNCIIAGKESLTVDLATCRLLRLDHKQSPPLTEAIQRRIKRGEMHISVLGEGIETIQAEPFRAPLQQSQESFIEIYGSIFPQIDRDKCVECSRCARACPMGAIEDFVINRDDCIKCLCCFEMCKNNAVELVKEENAEYGTRNTDADVQEGKREQGKEETCSTLKHLNVQRSCASSTPQFTTQNVQLATRSHAARRLKRNSIRILVLSNLYPPHFVGGYELACKEIADRLQERGNKVLVLTSMFGLDRPDSDSSEAAQWLQDGYPVIRRLDHSYGSADQLAVVDMPQSAYNEYLIRDYALDMQPDHIYLWNFHGLGMQSVMRVVAGLGVPYTFHAMDYHLLPQHGLPAWQESSVREFLSQDRCHIIAMSETVQRKFLDAGYTNTSIIYHGVDIMKCPPSGRPMRKLLYTGQVREGKGIHLILAAIKHLKSTCSDLMLDVFGEGDRAYEAKLAQLTQEHQLPVVFHGALPREELLTRYRDYDAFVFPTLREEPFGIVMIEAMNAGLPVVASNIGGPAEVITHGHTGMLFRPGDASELAQCLLQLYQDGKLYQRLASNAYRVAHERFDIEDSVSQIEAVLYRDSRHQAVVLGESIGQEPSSERVMCEGMLPLVWHAPIFDPSGYADEARNFTLALDRHTDLPLTIAPVKWSNLETQLAPEISEALQRLSTRPRPDRAVELYHLFPHLYRPNANATYTVGRTMFETDRIPESWVARCNVLDEIWVPTEFNMATFANSGVRPEKLFKLPGTFRTELYEQLPQPLDIKIERDYTFLTVFDWSLRKGWDVLLRAYFQEFQRDEGVLLLLKTYSSADAQGSFVSQLRGKIDDYIRNELGMDPARYAPYHVLSDIMSAEQMPQLYCTADAYVMPTRGEGWGRPYMEAMACALPTIGTRWGGNTEFMNEGNAYLLDYQLVDVPQIAWRELPLFRGHRWAEPSVEHLRETMRFVFEHREDARQKGMRARQHVLSTYHWRAAATRITERIHIISENVAATPNTQSSCLTNPPASAPTRSESPLRMVWEGPLFVHSSLARVNREISQALMQSDACELSLISSEPHEFDASADPRFEQLATRIGETLSGQADVHIRHQWPPNFSRPAHGRWVLMQPWEYGSMPTEWFPHLQNEVDEIWVYSNYNRNCYIEDGIPPEKIGVIPLAVDLECFRPDHVRWPRLSKLTRKRTVFLFVGGTIWRKGIDLLLDAYSRAFTHRDDVCLVIKDMGHNSFYRGQTAETRIRQLQSNPRSPEIIHLTEMLSDTELAQLYCASTCLVHPYRGEGFGLPVAEAMACGLPVMISQGGACDDFTLRETAYWIETERAWLEMEQKTVKQPWVLQPDVESLIANLRHVAANQEEALHRGQLAAVHIRETLHWRNTARTILERLEVVPKKPEMVDAAMWANERGKQLAGEEKWQEAIQEFLRATRLAPGWGEPWNNLAVASWNQQDYENAIQYLRLGLEQDPENMDLIINYALMTEQIGEAQEAIQILKEYLRDHPDAVGVQEVLKELQVA